MNKTDYNRFEITYLTDNIKFADQKAGLLIGVNGLLLRSAIDYFKADGITVDSLLYSLTRSERFFLIVGTVCLIIGIILCPRGGVSAQKLGNKKGVYLLGKYRHVSVRR